MSKQGGMIYIKDALGMPPSEFMAQWKSLTQEDKDTLKRWADEEIAFNA